ncbi:MAG: phage tail family protein [Lachnoclostridium sp.]|nr:phage tail family protein [Lachnoclostridium sp.]
MISKDNGVLIDNFHSYKDFKLILTKKTISSPELQEEYVDVPGRDGPIDLSEVLTGTVKFKERTISLSFFSLSPAQNWATEYSKLQNKLLGKRSMLIFDDDPDYYWNGRIRSVEQEQDGKHMQYSIEVKTDPYKMERYSSSEDWEWDTFDFEYGVINEGKDIKVDGDTKTYIYAGSKISYPTITSSAEMTLIFKGKSYNVPVGTTSMYEVILDYGDNELTFKGRGTITIEYRGGSL